MEKPYSHTVWRVKDGMQDEFVARWSEWVEWSRRNGFAASAMLIRDSDDPTRFGSFGPWETVDAVRSWRSLSGYQERVGRLQELVEGFDPRTLVVVAER